MATALAGYDRPMGLGLTDTVNLLPMYPVRTLYPVRPPPISPLRNSDQVSRESRIVVCPLPPTQPKLLSNNADQASEERSLSEDLSNFRFCGNR